MTAATLYSNLHLGMKLIVLIILPCCGLAQITANSLPDYDKASWNSQCTALAFRSSSTDWDGKWSHENQIGVYGGGWNKFHKELTSRSLHDSEKFEIIGNKDQVGVGLCIDSCDLETNFGLRWNYNCVGFYGDRNLMFAADQTGNEYKVTMDRFRSNRQGFTYDQENNCVTHMGSKSKTCTPLPDHFRGKAVRAVAQVWNDAVAKIGTFENGLRGLSSRIGKTALADYPRYDKSLWNSQCTSLAFRSSIRNWDGKWSHEDQIGVHGGGWNKFHRELTSRSLHDGEKFEISGSKNQIGVGLCIDSCDLETNFGLRWNYNCVGFYGDRNLMFAADQTGNEYKVTMDRFRSNRQGFTYDQENNCVTHMGSKSKTCTPLPDHFRGKPVRAVAQVWNSSTARILKYREVTSGTCESNNFSPIYDDEKCSEAAKYFDYKFTWGPHGGFEDVVDGCSIRFDLFLFSNKQAGICDPAVKAKDLPHTECECTEWMPCLCEA